MLRRKIAGFQPVEVPDKGYNPVVISNMAKKINKLNNESGIYPISAPGIPALPANSDFLYELNNKSENEIVSYKDYHRNKIVIDSLSSMIYCMLYVPRYVHTVEVSPLNRKIVICVPGYKLEQNHFEDDFNAANIRYGPRQADIMLIGKMPSVINVNTQKHIVGDLGDTIVDTFKNAGFTQSDFSNVYITNLIKHLHPDNKSVLKASWIKDGLHVLWQEIKIVQPKYIVCMGSEASKALLGTFASVSEMSGRVEELSYNIAFNEAEVPYGERVAKVFTIPSFKIIYKDSTALRQVETEVQKFVSFYKNNKNQTVETVEHTVIKDHATLLNKLIAIEEELKNKKKIIAVDAEWHGQHPVNKNSYLRTIQFSWKPNHAVGIVLHQAGGLPSDGFGMALINNPAEPETNAWGIHKTSLDLITTFFVGGTYEGHSFEPKRVVGHFFNADLEWLVAYGINIQSAFMCPLWDLEVKQTGKISKIYRKLGFAVGSTVPAWFRTKYEGGADTGLMCHAIEETASYKLETLAMRYTSAPRYDKELHKWKLNYCKTSGISAGNLEGYGECPDDVLLPYGMYDADVTLRLFYKFDELLDCDYDQKSCREAFWESQIATPAVLEIHRTGLTVDRARVDILTKNFLAARNELEVSLKTTLRWDTFNIRSANHVKELLFGEELNGKLDKKTAKNVRLRPENALTLGLKPLYDTSKPPKLWVDIEKTGLEREATPSTNKQNLSLLAQEAPPGKSKIINTMRDYRFLDQVLKTLLRPPVIDKDTQEYTHDLDGFYVYEDGLASMCCDDGKVRTHIYQTKETGRWSSARPNLQNISKQRDPDYKRLLGDKYKNSLRSVLKASPGHVLVEADYVGAELFGMAVMAGDDAMINHATRNQLPEEHPDFYDIHSNVAVNAFKLTCPPTKSGLESIGKKHIRIVAKSVIFGIAYGRGAKAISVAAKEQGIDVSAAEAQSVIDAIFEMYPKLKPFFEECQDRAKGVYVNPVTKEPVTDRVISNCFGRLRRFPNSDKDRMVASEFSRQAMNFPIQSMIASAVSRAIGYMHGYKRKKLAEGVNLFNIVLQIHDAILLEVPNEHVKHVCEFVFPKYMRKAVPIYPSDLEGVKTGAGPYYLGAEVEVMNHWGETLSAAEAEERGIPVGTVGAEGCVIHYSKK